MYWIETQINEWSTTDGRFIICRNDNGRWSLLDRAGRMHSRTLDGRFVTPDDALCYAEALLDTERALSGEEFAVER